MNIRNIGARETDGSAVTITDLLPAGITVQKVDLFATPPGGDPGGDPDLSEACVVVGQLVKCVLNEVVAPDGTLQLHVYLSVDAPGTARPLTNVASVSGGGASPVSVSNENQVSSVPPPFGPANFDFYIGASDGARDTQAGDHPYELSTTIDLKNVILPLSQRRKDEELVPTGVQDLKDVVVDLPLGFAGSTLAAPQCSLAELSANELVEHHPAVGGCPHETQVGYINTEPGGGESANSPIYNLVPERGVPGEFGYIDGTKNTHVFYAHVVPTPEGYVLQVTSREIPQITVSHIVVTFFGEPAVRDGTGHANVPFFTNPTNCAGGNLKATVYVDSWLAPAAFTPAGTADLSNPNWVKATSESPPVIGCDLLQFTPELIAQPTTSQADTPSGLEFELKLPQSENAGVHATPALKNATVTFPNGMTVDPSSGTGLQGCSVAQIGWLGGSPFNFNPDPPACPEQSKIGSLELETPLIPGVLHGEIYLAAPNENPFGSTFATYVVVNDPVTGVVLKIAGELKLDPNTGQITSYFPENAQLPFSVLKLHFFGGPRAELATPEGCGSFTTNSILEPWSAPDSGPNGMPFDSFQINSGCVSGFAPAFTAGATNLQAGAYTSFVASFSRQDSDQEMGGLSLTLPPGLLAAVGSVPQCTEAQIHAAEANTGGCPQSTRVGTVSAFAGPGPNPLFVAGTAYWTGPYKGAPFGLAVVVPAIAGPFTFGNVVVRQALFIDPHTAQATDVSDAFPTFVHPVGANGHTDGVPIKLKRIDVAIDRANFTFNGTNCSKLQVTGSLTSVVGQSSALATPFQVTNCSSLKFTPPFTASTQGNGKANGNGASLTVRIAPKQGPAYKSGEQEANIAKVDVSLPRALSSRLKTLQKACVETQFAANPAGCPPASMVGTAIVHTPVLPVPLVGPAIIVSHGGRAFPDLDFVLQGDGVELIVTGNTRIKNGITNTKFESAPDAPFASFEVNLPEKPDAILGAIKNLCNPTKTVTVKQRVSVRRHGRLVKVTKKTTKQVPEALVMPTSITAQNGAVETQSTRIAVTGCSKAVRASKKHHHKRGHKR